MQKLNLKPVIMIIDDEPINIRYIGELLGAEYELLAFTSGKDALLFLQSYTDALDVILLDVMMPDLDGFEVCRMLKQDAKISKVSVIFITALVSEQDEEKGFLEGGVDYIKKPFSKTIAKTRIDNQIKLKRYQDMLELSSITDTLTELPNKRYFNEVLLREMASLSRYKGYLSCLMIDIDNFKAYNDNYGHIAGDICLKNVAKGIESALMRKNDICARFGGEEFVVLLPGTDSAGAMVTANTILHAVSELNLKHDYSPVSKIVTLSIGCATTKSSMQIDAKTFLETADKALYEAKHSGKNRAYHSDYINN